jgi:uncharacterized protein
VRKVVNSYHGRMDASFCAGLRFDAAELASQALSVKGLRDPAFEGEPVESLHRFFEDGTTIVGVWECTPGRYPARKRGRHSIMYVLSGRATVTDADGTAHELTPGVAFVEPDGWSGVWHVHETLRKLYVISEAPNHEH